VKFKGVFHPVVISPDRIEELNVVNHTRTGEFLRSLFS
jgi:aldehyde oxidase